MDPLKIIARYYTPGTPIYETLVVHSSAVAERALAIAARHPELKLDTTFIYEAAMLHDIGVFLTDAPSIYCYGSHQYIEHGYLGAELMRKEGFERHALVCERHTGTGLTLERIITQNLPVPQRAMQPVSLEEQLICFADKFYSKTRLNENIAVDKIRSKLAKHGDESVAKFDGWATLFGTEI